MVHMVGNSYGGIVTLTLVIDRPDLVARRRGPRATLVQPARRHPPTMESADALVAVQQPLESVAALIQAGKHRAAAEHFSEQPGARSRLVGAAP